MRAATCRRSKLDRLAARRNRAQRGFLLHPPRNALMQMQRSMSSKQRPPQRRLTHTIQPRSANGEACYKGRLLLYRAS